MDEQQNLKTDYQDYTYIGNKKFNLINNSDGTISLEDVTDYEIEGDDFGANDINATNQRVNEMNAIGVYIGTCTDEELDQAISSSNDTSMVVPKDKDNNISDFKLPRYEKLKYDIVIGMPVETGIKKMGKNEYCVAYHFTNINAINTYSKPLGFNLVDKIITSIDVINLATSGAWFLPTASDSNSSEAASVALRTDNTIKITTKTGNIQESYVYVSYIDKN